ncbi:VIR protein [Plasmodium vivax]|uniref:VIR protein n=1 Tax=Plasmodium vivax TaxID=5855 RepID=A0A1G4H6N4_PLAVI|nr:VIR protein [Plasmodium vivax]
MSLTTETTDMEKWEEILKGSASYNMYNKFNAELKKEESEKPTNCKELKKENQNYTNEAYNLCRKTEKSLKYLHDIVVGGTRRYSCIHYKYWMSYKLLNMFKKYYKNELDKSVTDMFLDVQNKFVRNNNDYGCEYDYKNLDLNHLKEMDEKKYLHDYFRSYKTVKENIGCESSKKEMYTKYLDHISNLYKKYKEECSDDFIYWATNCPLYFKRGDEYDPEKLYERLKCQSSNNRGVQSNDGQEVPEKSPKKKKMTFYYLKCNNEDTKGYRRCALIPSTMEYTENKDKSKINDGEEEEEIPVSPDPAIVLGGILKNREQTTGPKTVPGKPGSHGSSQIGPSASRNDQFNSQYLTEADGISPYLVQTEDGIKWKIDDDETLDCKNYGSGDTYGLCKRLEELHKEGIFKLNPNPSRRKARIKRPSFERGDGLSDEGSYQTDEDDAYSSNTWDDMFSLLKTKQFRTGTTIVLIILLLDPSLEVKKEREEILIMNILKENRKSYLDVVNNR